MAIRFADRFGKGIRAAPRDALVGDSVDEDNRGKAYGFHKAMDTSGAALGLVLAALIVFLLQRDVVNLQFDTYRWMIIIGIVPAFIALFFFIFIKEPPRKAVSACDVPPTLSAKEKALDTRFKIFMVIMFLFTLGNSSDAFIILRAQDLGNSVLLISLMLIMFNVVYALFSMPAGILSDRLGRRKVIIAGWIVYALVYLGLAVTNQGWMIWLLYAFYGLYYGLTQGVYRALVCDLVPEERRGTAFGMYNGITGITLLPASLIAGWLWQSISPAAPFYFGAALAGISAIGLLVFVRE
jgi:MFS family permease